MAHAANTDIDRRMPVNDQTKLLSPERRDRPSAVDDRKKFPRKSRLVVLGYERRRGQNFGHVDVLLIIIDRPYGNGQAATLLSLRPPPHVVCPTGDSRAVRTGNDAALIVHRQPGCANEVAGSGSEPRTSAWVT